MSEHPMQPVELDDKGVARFKANRIVKWMLQEGEAGRKFDLNRIGIQQEFTDEDMMQLAQLIGYSVNGYAELSYVTDASYEEADRRAQKVEKRK